MDVPDREPYINSLIVNRSIYVPIMDRNADANALASYEAAMPGYEVIGVSNHCNHFPGIDHSLWSPGIALHCMTMSIADEQMLYIKHTPLLNRPPAAPGFPITAEIVALSGIEFVDGTPAVQWGTLPDGNDAMASWNTVPMARAPELGTDRYLAYIPAQATGTVIQYYLQAKDASGRDETHPYIGAPQAYTFTVTPLGANVSAVSAQRGGTIDIYMNAGLDNAQRSYRLTYSVSTDPNLPEEPAVALPDTAVLADFDGTLDDDGIATARLTIAEPLTSDWVGRILCFPLELSDQQHTALDAVYIRILE